MSNEQQKDEWETAEENLKALSIKEPAQAANLLLKHPGHVPSPGGYISSPNASNSSYPGDDVDPAIMNAIQNSRERMNVFHIEDSIVRFMRSNERTMELPMCNSFRRLLYYRIGLRFGLSHTQTDQLMQNGERTVVLYKTASSFFPATLLIDLAATTPVDTPSDGGSERGGGGSAHSGGSHSGGGGYGGYSNNAGGYVTNNGGGYHQYDEGNGSPYYPQPQQPYNNYHPYNNPNTHNANPNARKVQVMKRKPVLHTNTTRSTTTRTQQSAEDKERAYIEARARIFGESGTPEPEGSSTNSPFTLEDAAQLGDSECSTPAGSAEGSVAGASSSVGGADGSAQGASSAASNASSVGTTTGAVDGDSLGGTLSSSTTNHSSALSSAHSSGQVSKVPSSSSLAVLEGSGTSTSTINTAGIASGSGKSSAGKAAAGVSSSGGIVKSGSNTSLNSAGRGASTPTNATNNPSNATNNTNNTNPANYNANASNANNNTNNANRRAVVRNIDAERSDPDFVRRNVRGPHNNPNNSSGGYNNNYNPNNQYNNRSPRYNSNNSATNTAPHGHHPLPNMPNSNMVNTATMQYIDPQQAMYMQQMYSMNNMNTMNNMHTTLPPHPTLSTQPLLPNQPLTPEQMQMQLQLQLQYQQMQLQMQMQLQAQAQAQAQQVQYAGASSNGMSSNMGGVGVNMNPYYPNGIPQIPVPQGYVVVPGQAGMPPPMMDYTHYAPHPSHATHGTHNTHPMHVHGQHPAGAQQNRGNPAPNASANTSNNTSSSGTSSNSKPYKQENPAQG